MSAPERDRFHKLEQIFCEALNLAEGPERESFFAKVRHDDPETGRHLAELLDSRHQVVSAALALPRDLPRFGAWQTTRLLGRGGMGTVYLAERADGAFEMSAAVKVVPLALTSPEIEERFLKERQFLAMLSHPGISRLMDGGVSDSGLPVLVMEFVDGEQIDRYADRHSLPLAARVGLVLQMLDALAYVHSRQVLHRDLKPSSILADKEGRVKLVDFGIARLLSEGNGGGWTNGSVALTPDDASPEQEPRFGHLFRGHCAVSSACRPITGEGSGTGAV